MRHFIIILILICPCTIIFAAGPWNVTIVNNANFGTAAASSSSGIPDGNTVTLTATPGAGYAFVKWSGDIDSVGNPFYFIIHSNKTVYTNWRPIQTWSLTVTNDTGKGTATANAPAVPDGNTVILTATAKKGYVFSTWTGDITAYANPYSLVMHKNMAVTANYTAVGPWSVTLTTNTNKGTASASASSNIPDGNTVTLTAIAQTGYVFAGWTGNINTVVNPVSFIIHENKTVTANWAAIAPAQAATPSPANAAAAVALPATLSWTSTAHASNYNVYFGTSQLAVGRADSAVYKGNQSATTYNPGTLNTNTFYYWRIDANGIGGVTAGTTWSFATASYYTPSTSQVGWYQLRAVSGSNDVNVPYNAIDWHDVIANSTLLDISSLQQGTWQIRFRGTGTTGSTVNWQLSAIAESGEPEEYIANGTAALGVSKTGVTDANQCFFSSITISNQAWYSTVAIKSAYQYNIASGSAVSNAGFAALNLDGCNYRFAILRIKKGTCLSAGADLRTFR